MIRKTLITTTLAAALAFGPVAGTPAAADSSDAAKLLLGAIALGVVAHSINRNNDREPSRADTSPGGPGPRGFDPERHGRFSRTLPAQCEFEVRTWDGRRDVFGKNCLQREGVRTNRLPDRCEFEVRTDRGRRDVYGARCLRENGYRVEARRR
jgi:hypothetical protein